MFPGGPTYQGAAHLSRLFNQIALYLTRGAGGRFPVLAMGRPAVGDPFNAAVHKEAEHRASGGLEDPRQRPTAATMDPGDANDAALSQSPPEAASS